MARYNPRHFCNGGYLQRSSNDDDQIRQFTIMVNQTLTEFIGEIFAEEGYIRL
jgi:hypothetical protein